MSHDFTIVVQNILDCCCTSVLRGEGELGPNGINTFADTFVIELGFVSEIMTLDFG